MVSGLLIDQSINQCIGKIQFLWTQARIQNTDYTTIIWQFLTQHVKTWIDWFILIAYFEWNRLIHLNRILCMYFTCFYFYFWSIFFKYLILKESIENLVFWFFIWGYIYLYNKALRSYIYTDLYIFAYINTLTIGRTKCPDNFLGYPTTHGYPHENFPRRNWIIWCTVPFFLV